MSFLGVSCGGVALPGFYETGEVHGGVLKLVCWCADDVIVVWLIVVIVIRVAVDVSCCWTVACFDSNLATRAGT